MANKDVSRQSNESEDYQPQETTLQPGWGKRRGQQAQPLPASDAGSAQGPSTPQPIPRQQEVSPQNDIADLLMMIANLLPDGSIKDFIVDVAEWFENLSQNESFRAQAEAEGLDVRALIDGGCMVRVSEELRNILSNAVMLAANELPKVLQTFIGCFIGGVNPTTAPAPRTELTPEEEASLSPQQRRLRRRELRDQALQQSYVQQSGTQQDPAPQLDINMTCLFQAAMVYWRTRDISKTLMALLTCQLGGGGGGNGGGGGGGGIGGGLGFLNNPVVRCQQ